MNNIARLPRIKPRMRTEIVLISPDDARQILAYSEQVTATNPPLLPDGTPFENRALSRDVVEAYKRSMGANLWMLSHQGVALTPEMVLLDGRHRLTALSELNIPPLEMQVSYDCDINTFLVSDRGRRRSVGFVLGTSNRHAAVLRLLWIAAIGDPSSGRMASQDDLSTVRIWADSAIEAAESNLTGRDRTRFAAPVLAAAAARVLVGDAAHAVPLYESLCRLRYSELPPLAESFLRQVQTGKTDASSTDRQLELFSRAWIALDPLRADKQRVLIEDRNVTVREIGQAIRQAIQKR